MNKLNAQKIRNLLDSTLEVYVYDEVSSTNDIAKNLESGVVFALKQTAGRGRNGRSFYSGEGGLYFSLAMQVDKDIAHLADIAFPFSPGRLTISAGIAVCKALIELKYNAQIKWVNDVYVDGKKVCGILAEGYGQRAVLGIGINLASDIPLELSEKAASLSCEKDINEVAANVIKTLISELEKPDMKFLESHCLTLGKSVVTACGVGTAVDVDDSGALLVNINGEIKRFIAGEVEIASFK